jgi:hypothetical protein
MAEKVQLSMAEAKQASESKNPKFEYRAKRPSRTNPKQIRIFKVQNL